MRAFMWQEDLIGVAKFANASLHKISGWKARRKGGRQTFEKFETSKLRQTSEAGPKRKCDRMCGMTWQISGEEGLHWLVWRQG